MARPIKETPVLKGQHAINFLNKVNSSAKTKISETEKSKMRRDYEALKSISKF